MSQVIFNPAAFRVRYPEFNAVSDGQLTAFFDEATLYLSNCDNSIIQSIPRRTILLNMLTAHVGALGGALSATGATPPVGQVLSGTEGSVSAAFANVAPQGGSAAWYAQTPYGLAYWQATLNQRRMRYVPAPVGVGGCWPWRN